MFRKFETLAAERWNKSSGIQKESKLDLNFWSGKCLLCTISEHHFRNDIFSVKDGNVAEWNDGVSEQKVHKTSQRLSIGKFLRENSLGCSPDSSEGRFPIISLISSAKPHTKCPLNSLWTRTHQSDSPESGLSEFGSQMKFLVENFRF